MLYKLIIVDDEEFIRDSLSIILDWGSLGFEVVNTLQNGKKAIDYIQQNRVDVILTDIKMDHLTGLDIAKFVYEQQPDIKVVLISGFKEFDFARKAIQYNVEHYLLKPTKLNELKSVFQDLKTKLDKERIEKPKEQALLTPLVYNEFFIDIIMGVLKNKEEINERKNQIGLNFDLDNCKCCLIKIHINDFALYLDNIWKYGKDKFYTAIKQLIESTENNISFYMINHFNEDINLLCISNTEIKEEFMISSAKNYISKTKENAQNILKLSITEEVFSIEDNIYKLASNNLLNLLSLNTENSKKNQEMFETNKSVIEQQKLFLSYINSGNIIAVSNLFETFIEEFKLDNIKQIQEFVIQLFAKLDNKLNDIGINIHSASGNTFSYYDILKFNDIKSIKYWGKTTLDEIVKFASNNNETSQLHIISKAKEYVDENYSKDISLEDVGDYVFLNPTYLSRFFKQHTGENFTDYLVSVRMEKALEFLSDHKYKVYEVSSLVGYKSIRHFNKLIKQYSGYTPTEYRNNLRND